jgi:DNA invertase Pin-like site-specific DNA recombinase
MKILGYTRVSTEQQTNNNQKLNILEYAQRNNYKLDNIIEVKVSSRKTKDKREIDTTIEQLKKNDILLVYSLDRIGRSTIETLQIIEDIKNKGIVLVITKDNLVIDPNNTNPMNEMLLTMLSGFAQMERSFISERTKAGLEARKKQGIKLGRKKGSIGKSIFDEHRDKITELYQLGVMNTRIVEYIGVGTKASLGNYIKTREIQRVAS